MAGTLPAKLYFPLRGKHQLASAESLAKASQDKENPLFGYCLSCSDVLPVDPTAKRFAGGVRPGEKKVIDTATIEGALGAPYAQGGRATLLHNAPNSSGVQSMLVYAGPNTYPFWWAGDFPTGTYTWGSVNTNAMPFTDPDAADIFGNIYLCGAESASVWKVTIPAVSAAAGATLSHAAVAVLAAAANKGVVPGNCTCAANHRSRLVLAGQVGSPNVVYMSRCGDPTDWDYSQEDGQSAIFLNASSKIGQVGPAVKALVPFTRDVLILGCDRSLFAVEGDPASGGTVQTISTKVGMISRDGWCMDGAGALYWVGNGGFYRYRLGDSEPENLADKRYTEHFKLIETGYNISLAWDEYRSGVWIMASDPTGAVNKHLFYSIATDGFFPITLSVPAYSICQYPYHKTVYFGTTVATAYAVYKFDDATNVPVGITPFVKLGPVVPMDDFDSIVQAMTVVMPEYPTGETTAWNFTATITGGSTPSSVVAAPRHTAAIPCMAGRTNAVRRLHGGAFAVDVRAANRARWQFEHITLFFEGGGQGRRK